MKLAAAAVRPIPLSEARAVVERFEPMCVAPTVAYGLFIAERLASVVVFGAPPLGNLRRCDGEIALLRGVTLAWAPRNCGSALIRRAMRQLPPHFARVVAYADPTMGETGAIYRASGFSCLGPSRREPRAGPLPGKGDQRADRAASFRHGERDGAREARAQG